MLFVVGGNDGTQILKSVICFRTDEEKNASLPELNLARDELDVAMGTVYLFNQDSTGALYAVGGFGSHLKTCLRSVEVFQPQTGQWKLIPDMKFARRGCSAVIVQDILYVVGGFDGENYIAEMEWYLQAYQAST
jgi:hypothetical protein